MGQVRNFRIRLEGDYDGTATHCRFFIIMACILAFDYGRRRIGVALSDELGFAAKGLPTLHAKNQLDGWAKALETIEAHRPVKIVVGIPLNLDGSKSEMSEKVEEFISKIEEVQSVPVVRVDERLTSVAAKRNLAATGVKQKGNKGQVDQLAAVYLLEIYLQQQGSLGQI